MADTKITALTAITTVDPAVDVFPIVDVSDTTMAASGTTKKITTNQLLGASGTATLASASITGDLTVRTNKLAVTASGVGFGTASPSAPIQVGDTTGSPEIRLSGASTAAAGPYLTFYKGGTRKTLIGNEAVLIGTGTSDALMFYTEGGNGIKWNIGSSTPSMTLDTSSNLSLASGNLVMSTSGKGIDFSATANSGGTMTSELLNDYEEGTWTGTLTGGTTNPTTPVTATGRYTKVGREVTVQISFSNVNTTGAAGSMSVTGLPFANNGSISSVGSVYFYAIANFTGSPFVSVGVNESFLVLYANNSGAAFTDVTHNAGASKYLTASVTYTVA